jgi:hypothetical protein
MEKKKMITECCVCKEYRNRDNHRWYVPTSIERRDNYFHNHKKITHSYCPPCFILSLRRDGFSESEIVKMVEDTK